MEGSNLLKMGIVGLISGAGALYINSNMEESPIKPFLVLSVAVAGAGGMVMAARGEGGSRSSNYSTRSTGRPTIKEDYSYEEGIDQSGNPYIREKRKKR